MEEAEALCNRIGIMVNGRLSCLGSATHLRSRFGQGYQIDVNFDIQKDIKGEVTDAEIFQATTVFQGWIRERFQQWELLEQQNTHFKYRVDKSISLGRIFGEIQYNKNLFKVREYSVAQTSLEQIFMYFARKQIREDEVLVTKVITTTTTPAGTTTTMNTPTATTTTTTTTTTAPANTTVITTNDNINVNTSLTSDNNTTAAHIELNVVTTEGTQKNNFAD